MGVWIMSDTLLYVSFKKHPEFGRLKVVKDEDRGNCSQCRLNSRDRLTTCCADFDEVEAKLGDEHTCNNKSYHYEQYLVEK
jgi:hypothetical protein